MFVWSPNLDSLLVECEDEKTKGLPGGFHAESIFFLKKSADIGFDSWISEDVTTHNPPWRNSFGGEYFLSDRSGACIPWYRTSVHTRIVCFPLYRIPVSKVLNTPQYRVCFYGYDAAWGIVDAGEIMSKLILAWNISPSPLRSGLRAFPQLGSAFDLEKTNVCRNASNTSACLTIHNYIDCNPVTSTIQIWTLQLRNTEKTIFPISLFENWKGTFM